MEQKKVIVSMTEDFLKEMDDFAFKHSFNRSELIRMAFKEFKKSYETR